MIDKNFWVKIFAEQASNNDSHFIIAKDTSGALQASKQTIFALQRGRLEEAEGKLEEAVEILKGLEKRFGKNSHLREEGSWKAAVEEFSEAKLFMDFYLGKKLGAIKGVYVTAEEYLGGLSDATGEMVRMMVIWTTQKEFGKVKDAYESISEVIHELMKNNFTGYLRTKFDQAKNNLRKAEEILYDISIKGRS